VLIWILVSAFVVTVVTGEFRSQTTVPIALRYFSITALVYWTVYGALVWTATGFTNTPGVSRRAAISVACACLVGFGIGDFAKRRVERAEEVRRIAEAEAMKEQAQADEQARELRRIEMARVQEAERPARQEEQLRLDAEKAESERRAAEESLRKAKFVDKRAAEILDFYPWGATELAKDQSSAERLRRIGVADSRRAEPETGKEYLLACSQSWVLRKCARALAEAEYVRGKLFDELAPIRQ
jgi:flagellar biosynthesis GTPase FlhF